MVNSKIELHSDELGKKKREDLWHFATLEKGQEENAASSLISRTM